jgi:hypothetical protein
MADHDQEHFVGTSCVASFYAGLTGVLRSAFGIELSRAR